MALERVERLKIRFGIDIIAAELTSHDEGLSSVGCTSGRKTPSTISLMASSNKRSNVIRISWRARSVGSDTIRGVRRAAAINGAPQDGLHDVRFADPRPQIRSQIRQVRVVVRKVLLHVAKRLQTRLLLMSGSPDRLSKETKPWRSKATVTFFCRGRLKRLKRATRSWRASLWGKRR